jgi:hypothetical protein
LACRLRQKSKNLVEQVRWRALPPTATLVRKQ